MERLVSGSSACCSPACSIAQQPLRHSHRRAGVSVAAKRSKRSQGGGSGTSGPGLHQIEPDGSDIWRLGAAVDSIQAGGVRYASILPSLHLHGDQQPARQSRTSRFASNCVETILVINKEEA